MNVEYLSSFLHTVWYRITSCFSLYLCVVAIDGTVTVKVNLLLCMNAGTVEIQLSLLDGGEWSGLAPWLLYTWRKSPRYTEWQAGWALEPVLMSGEEKNFLCVVGIRPWIIQRIP